MESIKKEALVWGAGKIGRGFLAEIFADAGYHLTFIEYDDGLVQKMREARSYTLHKALSNGLQQEIKISDYEVYSSKDVDTITEKVAMEDTILAIAVHQKALPEVVKALIPGVERKAKENGEHFLNIILCINMLHPAAYCRQLFEEMLPANVLPYFREHVGLIESVVMRMAPEATPDMLARDSLAVLNNGYPEMPVDGKAFKGGLPRIPMLRFSEQIWAEEVRKIYTLNMAHAMLAYLGTPKGYIYAAECIQDMDVRPMVVQALDETGKGLAGEFGFDSQEMTAWNKRIIESLENPALRDRLDRLGADSKRKLGREDRLVGPALLCLKHGGTPKALAEGIARGFRFNQAKDEGTEEVQAYLKENGIEMAVEKYCRIDKGELANLIIEAYKRIP